MKWSSFPNVRNKHAFFVNFFQLKRVHKDEGVLEMLSLENELLILPLQ